MVVARGLPLCWRRALIKPGQAKIEDGRKKWSTGEGPDYRGTGFLGLMLARRLLLRGELTSRSGKPEPVDSVVLFDGPRRPAPGRAQQPGRDPLRATFLTPGSSPAW